LTVLPAGYVTILQASDILEQFLFAGLPEKPIVLKHRQAGLDLGDRAARDQAIAELWKAVDAQTLRAMAVGGNPRRILRLDPAFTRQVPLLRSPRGRGFTLLRPSSSAYHDLIVWFGVDIARVTLAFRETEVKKLGRRLMQSRRRAIRLGIKQIGRPSRQAAVCIAIRQVIGRDKWSPPLGLKALTREVNRVGKWPKPVSEDTATRALDRLYEDTQDRRFKRVRRNRR
jgi:hypothetical protein